MLTDGTAGTARRRGGTNGEASWWRSCAGWLRGEADLTRRMIADNLVIGLPPVVFAIAAGVHVGLPAVTLLPGVGKAIVLGLLFVYVYDSASQARSAAEDALNKPYRPVPAGLVTPDGLARRSWLAVAVSALLVWAFGAWPWALLWLVIVVVQVQWAAPRFYLWWKTTSNASYQVITIATGWQLAAPLDATAYTWIAVVSIYFTLAFIYEDVRDLEGDRAVGRRTTVVLFGPTFVRRWFATLLVLLPFVAYFGLARPSGAGDWRGVVCAAVIGILAWTCAARALLRHSHSADRLTYQLFCLTWGLTLVSAPLLLAGP